ncbi:CHAP domain-containing protein [Roseomonas arctica]|uniref:CHAP domain-containing protein n=2 Tax=Plastoroseomonas arctica TaxID=1509237 RepID=A0AAF1JYN8_9PROT|nr:CHAP domain-containing protein [Plastoroseomonas arctica]
MRGAFGYQSFSHVSFGRVGTYRPPGRLYSMGRGGRRVVASRGYGGGYGGGISCVPYAREATGMAISGNGRDWWHNASGLYDRSHRPEPGSVMAMPGTGAMRMGHVAVVERVIGAREIEIHHANWGGPGIARGTVMRGVNVVDVSAANDWSAVRIQTGHSDTTFGRVYPVYGFIHNRPDRTGGTMLAGSGRRPVDIAEGGTSVSLGDLRATEVAQGGWTVVRR